MHTAESVAAARRWFRLCGYHRIETADATIVAERCARITFAADMALGYK